MTPDTHHLMTQMVRHNRAFITSFENWTRKQPHSQATRELLQVFTVWRGMLMVVEQQLSELDVEGVTRNEVVTR